MRLRRDRAGRSGALRARIGLGLVAALLLTGAWGPTPSGAAAVPASAPGARPVDLDPGSVIAEAVHDAARLSARDRRRLRAITGRPTATWVTGSDAAARAAVRAAVRGAARRRATPVLALYRIPHRDCGHYSRLPGGVTTHAYRRWVRTVVSALGRTRAVVVVEPDALAQLSCLSASAARARVALLRGAVDAVAAQGSWAYLDAGHAGWQEPRVIAARLRAAGVARATGFSLNVAGFGSTAAEVAYGTRISRLLGGAHFIVDTSRNGAAVASGVWCNPTAARIGRAPTWRTGNRLVDAYLWIKTPGLSDGTCRGGPPAGVFWPAGALRLLRG